ncbi:hypothetical protein [Streptomyces sp. NPDC005407]|uniref:hypothetical protein n=1 Tax=Streptomyces sp. NPDC005407 TaxID=3155340 RepID=UPI0033A6C6DF
MAEPAGAETMALASQKVASRSAVPRRRLHDLHFRGDRCYTTWWDTILKSGESSEGPGYTGARKSAPSSSPHPASPGQPSQKANAHWNQRVIVLGELRELVLLLEQQGDIATWLREKVRFAQLERRPLALLGSDF